MSKGQETVSTRRRNVRGQPKAHTEKVRIPLHTRVDRQVRTPADVQHEERQVTPQCTQPYAHLGSQLYMQMGPAAVQIFAANERMNQILIEQLAPGAWKAKPPGKVRSIAAIFTHMHNVRCKWVR